MVSWWTGLSSSEHSLSPGEQPIRNVRGGIGRGSQRRLRHTHRKADNGLPADAVPQSKRGKAAPCGAWTSPFVAGYRPKKIPPGGCRRSEKRKKAKEQREINSPHTG